MSVVSVMNVTDGEPSDVGIGHPDGMLPPPGPDPGEGVQSVTVLTISVAVETVLVWVEMLMLPDRVLLVGCSPPDPGEDEGPTAVGL